MDANEERQSESGNSVERQIAVEAVSRKAATTKKAMATPPKAMALCDVTETELEIKGDPPTDYEYDSPQDSDASDSNRDILPIAERHVIDEVDVGEAIAYAYPTEWDYDIDDERHMFDDGLSSDENEQPEDDESSDSDSSSNYEELGEAIRDVSDGDEDIEEDDDKVEGEEEDESGVGSIIVDGEAPDSSLISGSEYEDDTSADNTEIEVTPTKAPPSPVKAPPAKPKTLDELRKADILLTKEGEARDKLQWKVKELYEMLHEIERQILFAESNLQAAEIALESGQEDNKEDIVASGLSPALFEAFKDFCESLHPRYGLREGFSVELEGKHGGSYTQYDPTFKLFKECVEFGYKTCNFRCEASSVEEGRWIDDDTWRREEFDIVEFFPIRSPEPVAGADTTWGMQFPVLYDLAFKAAKEGSAAAIDMLVRLPTVSGKLGGWIFEYKPEDLMQDQFIESRRWVFCCAHEVEKPLSAEAKKYLLLVKPS